MCVSQIVEIVVFITLFIIKKECFGSFSAAFFSKNFKNRNFIYLTGLYLLNNVFTESNIA